jgi:replicative DNA helicase
MTMILGVNPGLSGAQDDPRLDAFRQLPHNVEAEKALIGAIFINNRAFEVVSEYLRPEHFALGQNGTIYEACGKLIDQGKIADPITLRTLFEGNDELGDIGGAEYLMELTGSAVGVINAGEYGRVIFDLAQKRELIEIGQSLTERAYSGDVGATAEILIEDTERELYELGEGRSDGKTARSLDSITDTALLAAEKARESADGILGLPTGFADVDRILGGLAPSDLIVLGARPGMGKTAIALNIARHVATKGTPVGIFSLEMSDHELLYRLAADHAGVEQYRVARGQTSDAEWAKVKSTCSDLSAVPIHIDDTAGLSIDQIRSRARRMKRRHGCGLFIIDHMGLVRANAENRTQEITRISGGLKALAKDLNLPVLALSQLNRSVETREDKRPMLADLRESGSIEQDADAVCFLYRPAYYLERDRPQPKPNETEAGFKNKIIDWEADLNRIRRDAELIVAKNRHGRIAPVHLFFDAKYGRFGCRAQEWRGAA